MGSFFPDHGVDQRRRMCMYDRHGIGYGWCMSQQEINDRLHAAMDRSMRRTRRRFWVVLVAGIGAMQLIMSLAA